MRHLTQKELLQAIDRAEQVFLYVEVAEGQFEWVLVPKTAARRLANQIVSIDVQHDGGGLCIGHGVKRPEEPTE